jgi:GAF domain-containing protein
MKAAAWRVVALLVIAAAAVFVCYDTLLPVPPEYGLRTANQTMGAAQSQRVISVAPNSPGAMAGIRIGDTISFGKTPLERAEASYSAPGSRISVVVNGSRTVSLLTPRPAYATILLVPLVIRLAFLAVAALLAWRRWEDSTARALVLFLLCYGLLIGLPNTVMPTPLLSVLVLQTASTLLLLVGTAAAATFAAEFPDGAAQPVPRALARITQILTLVAAGVTIAATSFATTEHTVALARTAVIWLFVASALLVIAILIVAYVQGAAWERQRRRWVFLMLGTGLVAVAIDIAVQNTTGGSEIVDDATLLLIGAIPFGLAYVILRHRVIDVGFVINRAVVYSAVSIIIVGIIVIVDTLTSRFVEQHSRAASMAVQLAIALVLGFSIRFINARVEQAVDRVLFRQRHLDEAAIADFTLDAQYVTDAGVLLERCVATAMRHGHATAAGVWLRGPSGLYEPHNSSFTQSQSVDENDPALVAMRARRVVADLHALGSALPGVLAFPMIVRGELNGALVCGNKEYAEAYAPDEIESLRNMAAAVGHALEALRVRELEERVRFLERASSGYLTPAPGNPVPPAAL